MVNLNLINLLWLLLFVLPILFFYFLRYLYRKQPISSGFLWSRIFQRKEGFISLKYWSIILLVIQLIAVIFGIFSLSDPEIIFKTNGTKGLAILIDVSCSMRTLENMDNKNISRIDLAKKIVYEELNKIDKKRKVIVFVCSSEAKRIVGPTASFKKIISNVEKINADYASLDEMEIAKDLSLWISKEKNSYDALLITDGSSSLNGSLEKIFRNSLSYNVVGKNKNNFSISGLRVDSNKINFSIVNGFENSKNVNVSLTHNGKTIFNNDVAAVSGESYHVLEFKGMSYGDYKINISNIDSLMEDNESYFAYNEPYKVKVLLVGKQNNYIDSIFRNNKFAAESKDKIDEKKMKYDYDFIIVNNNYINLDVKNNIILFGYFNENKIFKRDKLISGRLVLSDYYHPVLRYMDNDFLISNALDAVSIKNNDKLYHILFIDKAPVASMYDDNGFLKIVFGFDLENSNFGNSEMFPIFMNNVFKFKIPQWDNELAANYIIGKEYLIYVGEKKINTKGQEGIKINRQGVYLGIKTDKPGFYKIDTGSKEFSISSNIDISEMNISPKEIVKQSYEKDIVREISVKEDKKNISILLLFIFMIFLIAEWFLWNSNFFLKNKKD